MLRSLAIGLALLAVWVTVRNVLGASGAAFFTALVYVPALLASILIALAFGLYALHVRRREGPPGRRVVIAGTAAAAGVLTAWVCAVWAQQIAVESMIVAP